MNIPLFNILKKMNILKCTKYKESLANPLDDAIQPEQEKEPEPSRMDLINMVNYDEYEDIEFVDNGKPILLIMDDMKLSKRIYEAEFTKIKNNYNKDVREEFNIVWALGSDTGYETIKFIKKHKVDYAILDITLGSPIKLSNGDYIEIDGIDVSACFKKYCPDGKFIFSTAHTLNFESPTTSYYRTKMIELTGVDLLKSEEYLSFKNSNQLDDIYRLLYGENNAR